MDSKCKRCSNPPVVNRKTCQKHLEYELKCAKERRARLRSKGLCAVCSTPTVKNRTLCPKHIIKSAESRTRSYSKIDSNRECRTCRSKLKDEERLKCLKCIDKRTWHEFERKYKLTKEEWMAMYDKQHGRCLICDKAGGLPGIGKRIEALFVDHSHTTGKVRGLLCYVCNMVLGLLNDEMPRAKNILEYLEKNK